MAWYILKINCLVNFIAVQHEFMKHVVILIVVNDSLPLSVCKNSTSNYLLLLGVSYQFGYHISLWIFTVKYCRVPLSEGFKFRE